ncbi:MAG TPA: ATP-binding protein [Candidatus Polarisedimenticolaceae bacterium]|nr:ATP-binding protein [Candidatus Polarisedimenticolaceae bacterium]
MRLRRRLLIYLGMLHVGLAALGVLGVRDRPWLLLGIEVGITLSLLVGAYLVRRVFLPVELVQSGAELIGEADFTTRLLAVGEPGTDHLIEVYNKMIDRLREERLRHQEQNLFLDRVLAASPAGVVTLDFEGRIAQANPAAERILGSRALTGLTLPDVGGPLAAAMAALEGSASHVAAAGARRWKVSRTEFYDRGHPRAVFVLEELTDELRASERAAYEKLIRMVTHEVHNSVGAVGSLLDSLGHYGPQLRPEDRADFAQAVAVAGARLQHLRAFIGGFAEVVRLPSPDLRPVALAPLLDDLLALLKPQMEARRIVCRWDRKEPVPDVQADKNQIEQVLVNVLKNAMEAVGGDGRIGLHLWREDGHTTLAVRDSGPGIAPEARDRLFTPFFSTKRDGLGLGLTLVAEVLAGHRATFDLRDAQGGGAEFRVSFGG